MCTIPVPPNNARRRAFKGKFNLSTTPAINRCYKQRRDRLRGIQTKYITQLDYHADLTLRVVGPSCFTYSIMEFS
jgi:hypothetical protein